MDIPLDPFARRQIGLGPAAVAPPLDWPGLSARLAAAHAARQVLESGPTRPAGPSGSFAPGLAGALADWRANAGLPQAPSSLDVNLTAKADRKPPGPIGHDSTGGDRCVVRGLL